MIIAQEAQEAAQAASTPRPVAQPPRAPEARPAASPAEFAAALGFVLAKECPALAESIEAHLNQSLAHARAQRSPSADGTAATLEWFRDLRAGADIIAQAPAEGIATPPLEAEDHEVPAPTAEAVLWRVQSAALVDALGPKRGERFVRGMAELLAKEQSLADVVPIRGAGAYRAVAAARRGAVAMFRQVFPMLIAKMHRAGQ